MENKNNFVLQLIIAIVGVFITMFGLVMFNQHLLLTFSLPLRMVLMIVTQWSLFIVPGILMIISKEKLIDLGFSKTNILKQILIGIGIALLVSLIFTVIPILVGLRDFVGATTYTKPWQFAFEFVYALLGVALVEELIFRGYIFKKLLDIKNSKWFAIIISSLIFGFFHIFNGDILQVIVTFIMGIIFCLFREKIKNCSTLSLIIIHGLHNGLIILWLGII